MSQSSHWLGQVDRYEGDPSLDIPPLAYRQDLSEGDLAMLLDEFEARVTPLWAEIEQVLGPGWYLGRTESGVPVEFGANHIADIEHRRGPSMGAWYDHFRPSPPRPSPPVTGVFRHFARGGAQARQEPPRSQSQAQSPPPPPKKKGSFFDWFRGKPKVEVGPIPAAERREQRPEPRSFLRFPGVTPPPPGAPPEMAPQSQSQYEITPMEAGPEISDELFQVLDQPSASAPEAPQEPLRPTGAMIVAPEVHLPAQVDAFSILEAEPAQYGPPGFAPGPFEILPAGGEPPSAFDILESSPEEIAPGGMVVRPSGDEGGLSTASAFDILEPEPPGGLSVYEPPEPAAAPTPTVFSPLEPERPAPPPKAAQKKTRKKTGPWRMPTREEWVRWIESAFDLDDLWRHIRVEQRNNDFIALQENEEGGDPPIMPIETWADLDWDSVFKFFGIPENVWGPYVDRIHKEEEEAGVVEEGWEDFNVNFLYPLSQSIGDAFKSIQPKDIPGSFILEDDSENGTWGLLYYEPLTGPRKEKQQKERARLEKEQKEEERARKVELKRIWGGMPKAEDIVPWIEERFDLDAMFGDIKKARKTKQWKEDVDYGDANLPLEVVADLGPKRAKEYDYDVASYFGIPPDVVDLYRDANSNQELWSEVFWPFFDNIREAFSMLLPYADLPGEIVVDEDEDQLVIQYREGSEG